MFPMSLLLAPLRVPLLGLFLYVCMYVIITLNENLYDRYWMDGWMDYTSPCQSIIHRKLNNDVETRTGLVCIITSSYHQCEIELTDHQAAYIYPHMHSSSHLSFSRASQMTRLYIAPGSSLPMQLPLPSQVQLLLS
jgi:hypothetical protein